MKLTISTFLFTTLHFALARSSLTTTLALPPVMAAFPFIPVLAYTLIISAFSYISARILKHFNSDLLTFLRRKGRFTPLPITRSHELLPTSTATRPATPSIGVYAASSNVTIPRSASLNALPVPTVLPPRLISPASSPPQTARSRSRRAANPSLASFSILKPTVYRHKHRRSRSLGVPIPRPERWPSQFPPSPPTQQYTINTGRRRNSEDDIPLAFLSRATDHLSHEPPTLEPSPMLQEPSISVPPLLMSDPLHGSIHGPLIDISPLSPDTSSSSHQSSSLVDLSSSSTDLSRHSYPTSSDSSSPSRSTQGSDIGAQPMGELAGFAYDWGFDNDNTRKPPRTADPYESFRLPLLPSGANEQRDIAMVNKERGYDRYSENSNPESQGAGRVEQVVYDVVSNVSAEVSDAPIVVQQDMSSGDGVGQFTDTKSVLPEPDPITEEKVLCTSIPPVLTTESVKKIILARTEDQADQYTTEYSSKAEPVDDDMNALNGETTSETSRGDLQGSPPPLQPILFVENINIEVRPSIIIDIPDSGKEEKHSLALSPSQIPTPPASPPSTPISITRSSSSSGKPQLVVASDPSMSKPVSSVKTGGDIATEELAPEVAENEADSVTSPRGEQKREDDTTPAVTLQPAEEASLEQNSPSPRDVADSPTNDNLSPGDSPRGSRPAWSVRATDAPPLGLSTTQAASVQEEVAWPRKSRTKTKNKDTENVKIEDESKAINQVTGSGGPTNEVPTLPESKSSVPGSFPEGPSQEQTTDSSTPVARMSGVARRRQNMRGLPIDVALAMQMRPGLGVGADPAWMVRFLMTVFGWLAIMIAGRGGEVDVYAL
ncbi:hypothetical protein AX15_000347 [Amanita polypyramis BW_CC]|nr:hypothetical protein AX15_000347 [Amanita polypyramis BW_CC]